MIVKSSDPRSKLELEVTRHKLFISMRTRGFFLYRDFDGPSGWWRDQDESPVAENYMLHLGRYALVYSRSKPDTRKPSPTL